MQFVVEEILNILFCFDFIFAVVKQQEAKPTFTDSKMGGSNNLTKFSFSDFLSPLIDAAHFWFVEHTFPTFDNVDCFPCWTVITVCQLCSKHVWNLHLSLDKVPFTAISCTYALTYSFGYVEVSQNLILNQQSWIP